MEIKKDLQQVPSSPGIYIMKDSRGSVLYVGKAKNLRNRLRSYFQGSASLDARKSRMVQEVKSFEYIVTKNELEALVLEANFIKRSRPRYNIILRDDKNYPYLKLTVNEEWPRLEVVRRIEKDGALYFGPYVPSGAMREILNFIRRTFPVRTCRYNLKKPFRPCVRHQMKRCLAPCDGSLRTPADRSKYMEAVDEVRSFITGEKRDLLSSLQKRMEKYSEQLKFEEAAAIRDRIKALERAWETQGAIAPELADTDVIGIYREKEEASLFILFIRNGTVIGRKDFFLTKLGEMESSDIVSSFIEQFYSKEMLLPSGVIIPVRAAMTTQRQWLSKKRGRPVRLSFAKKEAEHMALKMACDNAMYSFNKHRHTRVDETLLEIKDLLDLETVPSRIGAIDISNISGAEATGALVIYENGRFAKDSYRLFRIKTVKGINDFAMIGEVTGRYMGKALKDAKELPQLLLIDGGKGQLESAMKAIGPFDLQINIAAIAKAKTGALHAGRPGVRRDTDRIYLPGKKAPVYLEPFMPSTLLLQKIRDEVHRYAVSYHKKLRSKRMLESPLEKAGGIGKKRRLLLLRHFGSIDRIRKASTEELAALKGMNRKAAENLKKVLGK